MGPDPAAGLPGHGHGRREGVRSSGRRVLRPAPEQRRGHPPRLPAERGTRRLAMRRQLAPPLGGEQELPGGGQAAGVGGEAEEDIGHVRGVGREAPAARDRGRQHLPARFEHVHDDAGHHLSGRRHAEVSFGERKTCNNIVVWQLVDTCNNKIANQTHLQHNELFAKQHSKNSSKQYFDLNGCFHSKGVNGLHIHWFA